MAQQETIEATAIEVLPAAAPTRAPVALTPVDMLDRALASGAGIDILERLMGMQERWEAAQQRKAFDAALSDAKGEFTPIQKNRLVNFESKSGGAKTNYRFEDFAAVAEMVDPILSRHGLSYRFRTEQKGPTVRVTCIIAHRDGYSEENSLEAGVDTSGNKNAIQGIGSTQQYLMRYTLKAALGLAVAHDDDGQAGGAPAAGATPERTTLNVEEVAELRRLVEETGSNMDLMLKAAKAESIETIHPSNYGKIRARLLEKKAKPAAA